MSDQEFRAFQYVGWCCCQNEACLRAFQRRYRTDVYCSHSCAQEAVGVEPTGSQFKLSAESIICEMERQRRSLRAGADALADILDWCYLEGKAEGQK